MTIRSALNDTRVSSTAAIVEISMPKENDYFEIGNLIISSHFYSDLRGVVNLTWEVPANMEQKIVAFDVQYVEAENDNWQKVNFHGRKPSALLHDLKSDTEYVLRIKTRLTNNIEIESGEFRFKTPKVETNPIQKVDVIYSHDVNSVRLQWILEPHVKADLVAGYDVYVSDNKDRPDSQWKLVRLDNREAALALDNLRDSTEYFVRVDVRNKDGSVIKAPLVYRFKTIGKREREGNLLAFRNLAPGQVEISWTYPPFVLHIMIGQLLKAHWPQMLQRSHSLLLFHKTQSIQETIKKEYLSSL
ncbi:unnamed protein product [Angiostrongylus costaricensis]|uniref:Fibronectin type-III domain-containing protein n=1 Tax=Angiostrongylus costaricensis TaxID=334426 RepID=A0A0R3PVJ0_ANGCS|nr:unnamed protein product [Angiostrongylus costaricensis]